MTGNRESAANRPKRTVETELTGEYFSLRARSIELTCRDKNPERYWQVERGSIFSPVSRGEIHGYPSRWQSEAGVDERRAHAFPALLNRALWKTHHYPLWKSQRSVDFHEDIVRIDPEKSRRVNCGKHR